MGLTALWLGAKELVRALSPKQWLITAVVVMLVFLAAGWWCSDRRADRVVRDEANRQAELQKGARAADNNAADARLQDERTIDRQTESLNDAVRDLPDARPSERRIARNCQRMRNAGITDLPAECGPGR